MNLSSAKIAYISLGSNMGDRLQHLQTALQFIQSKLGLVTKQSKVYETAAWGYTAQTAFYNQVLELLTPLTPPQLIETCLEIEQLMGRVRGVLWGERSIDIDILLYDGRSVQLPNLQIPHPYLHLRRFVLVPLCEISPLVMHPTMGLTMQQLLDVCPDDLETAAIDTKS